MLTPVRCPRSTPAAHLTRGWLAFRSDVERRRRAPIPIGWVSMTDDELLDVLRDAESSGDTPRLIE